MPVSTRWLRPLGKHWCWESRCKAPNHKAQSRKPKLLCPRPQTPKPPIPSNKKSLRRKPQKNLKPLRNRSMARKKHNMQYLRQRPGRAIGTSWVASCLGDRACWFLDHRVHGLGYRDYVGLRVSELGIQVRLSPHS